MKSLRRFSAMLLALLLIAAMFSATAFAALKTTPLKLGAWYGSFIGEQETGTVYKVKFTEDKIVSLKWKGVDPDHPMYVTLTTLYPEWVTSNRRKEYDPEEWNVWTDQAAGTSTFVISAGTYYVYGCQEPDYNRRTYANASAATGKFCLTAKKLGRQPANYTPARAKALKAGAKAMLRYTPMNAHRCWFRITLPKRQKLTIARTPYLPVTLFMENLACIYDSENSKEYKDDFTTAKGKITSKYKLDKGTYYVRVNPIIGDFLACFFANDVSFFKWN